MHWTACQAKLRRCLASVCLFVGCLCCVFFCRSSVIQSLDVYSHVWKFWSHHYASGCLYRFLISFLFISRFFFFRLFFVFISRDNKQRFHWIIPIAICRIHRQYSKQFLPTNGTLHTNTLFFTFVTLRLCVWLIVWFGM